MCSSNTQPFQLGTMPLIPPSNTERSFGVRKGAWTKEEDDLLKKCINKHGEGNWHQVPHKAGLNRCRKSCRLRWLNYLRPNIKRGDFMSDEVDLIVRMHKLLGNRWSLIAGRIPGRTANDIKNYWNTHLNKKLLSPCNKLKLKIKPDIKIMKTSKVVKPHPRTFSKNSQWLRRIGNSTETTLSEKMPSKSPTELVLDQSEQWWKSILSEEEKEKMGTSSSVIESGEDLITSYCVEGLEPQNTNGGNIFIEEGKNDWDDLYLNMNLWGFLEPEQETMM